MLCHHQANLTQQYSSKHSEVGAKESHNIIYPLANTSVKEGTNLILVFVLVAVLTLVLVSIPPNLVDWYVIC